MNKRLIALLALLCFALAGCSGSLNKPQAAVFACSGEPGCALAPSADTLLLALEEKGLAASLYAVGDEPVAAFYQAVKDGCNVFVAALSNADCAQALCGAAKKADLPIVFCGADPGRSVLQAYDKAWYVGGNLKKQGEVLGEALTEYRRQGTISDKNADHLLQYTILSHTGEPDERMDATLRVLENYGVFSQQLTVWTPVAEMDLSAALTELTAELSDTELYLCADAELAALLLDALNGQGLSVPVSCYDFDDSLPELFQKGLLACSVYDEKQAVELVSSLTYNVSRKAPPTDGTRIRLDDAGYTYADFYLQTADLAAAETTGENND